MNADTTSPTPPTQAPVGGPQPIPPAPGATTPADQHHPHHHHHHHGHVEPNALLEWSKKAWEGLKSGHFGNPRILALALAVVAILAAWWFLARSSGQADSALWVNFDLATDSERIKTFTNDSAQANTVAVKIAKLNDARLRADLNLQRLTDNRLKLADRVAAADALEKLRDELSDMAGQFDKDRTLKAEAYLAAAEVEMGLIGVPKKGVVTMGVDVKGNCRGQIERYADLKRKAADAIGPTTEAGQQFLADADKYSKEPAASELYSRLGTFHAKFNDPDPLPLTPEKPLDPNAPKAPVDPTTPKAPDSIPGGDSPKAPDKIPEPSTPKGDEKKPGDAPKAPENPFKDEKKPDEKK